jgi:hypothetical protein
LRFQAQALRQAAVRRRFMLSPENAGSPNGRFKNALNRKLTLIKAVFSGGEQYMILSTCRRQNHYHPVYAYGSSLGLLKPYQS